MVESTLRGDDCRLVSEGVGRGGSGEVFLGGIQLTDFWPKDMRDFNGEGVFSLSLFSSSDESINSKAPLDMELEDVRGDGFGGEMSSSKIYSNRRLYERL